MSSWGVRMIVGVAVGLVMGLAGESAVLANCCNCVNCDTPSTGANGCVEGATAPGDCGTLCEMAGFGGCSLWQFTGGVEVCDAAAGACLVPTRTVTQTPTITQTPTVTQTGTVTSTRTETGTATHTATATATSTATSTGTATSTATDTPTATATATSTSSATPVDTPTVTATGTATATPQPDGAACAGPSQCVSGFCADGVCCNTACDQPLQSCNLPGQVGSCASTAASAPSLSRAGLLLAMLLLSGVALFALARQRRS